MNNMFQNIIFKGQLKSVEELEVAELPSNAIRFKEPNSVELFVVEAYFVAVLVILIVVELSKVICANRMVPYYGANHFSIIIVCLWIIQILPHEVIHAVCYGGKAKVCIYIDLKHLLLLCHSTAAISKKRFVLMSMMPSIIFAVVPYLIWVFHFSCNLGIGPYLLSYCIFPFIMGAGDYINVITAIICVPSGAHIVNSGMHSYYYV